MSAETTTSTPRLPGIEALRGLAALGVVGWHQLGFSVTHPVFGYGFKSVSLFFVISGFVLGYGYEQRLWRGLGPVSFIVMRLRRLYPLYLVGTLLGLALALAGLGLSHMGPAEAISAFPAALCLWPNALLGQQDLFPLDAPAWSLLLEIEACIGYALLVPRLSNRMLVLAIVIGFVGLDLSLIDFGTLDGGWTRSSQVIGIARILYAFPAGVLLQRLWRTGRLKVPALPVSLVGVIFLAFLAVPPVGPSYALIGLIGYAPLWPLLVLAAANARCAPWEARVARALGEPSYALYILHFPLIVALHRLVGPPGTPKAHAAGALSFALAWLLALVATALVDRWARVASRRHLSQPAVAAPSMAAPA